MPTYAYACTACEHRFEAQQSFSDDALTECPECTGRVRKLFSSVGIVFKGSGFYRNDSRATKGADATGSSGNGKGSGDSAGSTSTSEGAKSDGSAANGTKSGGSDSSSGTSSSETSSGSSSSGSSSARKPVAASSGSAA